MLCTYVSRLDVTVTVEDLNDNVPVFEDGPRSAGVSKNYDNG